MANNWTINNINETTLPYPTGLVSDAMAYYIQLIVLIVTGGSISVLGIGTNIINIIIFVGQMKSLGETTVSLLALAVSDLCLVLSVLWFCIVNYISTDHQETNPWATKTFAYYFGGVPLMLFSQITRLVTALVAVERCICVLMPFKFKKIFTSRKILIGVVSIFLGSMMLYSPIYIMRIFWDAEIEPDTYSMETRSNRTMDASGLSHILMLVEDTIYYLTVAVFNLGALFTVLICTLITVIYMNRYLLRRLTLTARSRPEDPSTALSRKDVIMVRIITFISGVFLVCNIPELVGVIMYMLGFKLAIHGQDYNLTTVLYSFIFLAEAIKSSTNMFILYNLSARYERDLNHLLGCGDRVNDNFRW